MILLAAAVCLGLHTTLRLTAQERLGQFPFSTTKFFRQKLDHLQEENDALRRKEAVLVDERNRLQVRCEAAEREASQLRAFIAQHRDKLGDVAAPLLDGGGGGAA